MSDPQRAMSYETKSEYFYIRDQGCLDKNSQTTPVVLVAMMECYVVATSHS